MSDPGAAPTLRSAWDLMQPLGLHRLVQLFSTCGAFFLVGSMNAWAGATGNWCMFAWCFCFGMTFVTIVVELCGLHAHCPQPWRNVPFTFACYATLLCLSASVIYPATHVYLMPPGPARNRATWAVIFSCFACVAYASEVTWTRARAGQSAGYMATLPGLLKVLETCVGCMIFAFLGDPHLYNEKPALQWCVGAYAVCFALAALAVLLSVGGCPQALPVSFRSFLSGLAVFSFLLYASAAVLWPLYQFNERHGGRPKRWQDFRCHLSHTFSLCFWDRSLAVTVLTVINLLAYATDLVTLAHPGFLGA